MKTARVVLSLAFVPAVLLLVCRPIFSEEPVRGVVVDRSGDILWLGLPSPVQKGAVFDVKLVPGGRVIARAVVIEATPDAPYVAQARFALEDPSADIPIGAFVEATEDVVAEPGESTGFNADEYGEIELRTKAAKRLSLQAGLFFPSESELGDETGDLWPAFQLRYRIGKSESCDTGIGLGYYHRDGDFSVGGIGAKRDFRVLPLTVDAKFRSSKKSCSDKGWFTRLGVGAYYIEDERRVANVTQSETVTTFGWQAGLGYESKSGRLAQVFYVDVAETDFQGLVFSVGARF